MLYVTLNVYVPLNIYSNDISQDSAVCLCSLRLALAASAVALQQVGVTFTERQHESLGQSVSFTLSDCFSIAFLHTQHDRLGRSRSPTILLVYIHYYTEPFRHANLH